MNSGFKRVMAANAVMFSGISFTIIGAGTLLSSMAGGSRGAAFLASFAIVAGVILAAVAVRLHRGARFIFCSAFLIQSGIFLIVFSGHVFKTSLRQLWPVFVLFAGIAMFPAGWFRYRRLRARYLIPMIAFLVLGFVFLLFSFGIIAMSFRRFIVEWWPLLLIMAGVFLTLLSFVSQPPPGEPDS